MLLRHRPDGALREGAIGEVPELIGWSGEGAMTHDLAFAHVAEWAPGRRQGRVVVVGAGPAGLYAALVLGTNGVAVDLIDRGADLRQRGRDVARFHRTRVPKPESNLLFGEGGAGTYSDGKLTLSSVVSPP